VANNGFGLVDSCLWRDCRTVDMVESVREIGDKEPRVERRKATAWNDDVRMRMPGLRPVG